MSPLDWLWLFFIFSSLQPIIQRSLMAMNRRRILATIAARRDATVITLIHRQETISLLGRAKEVAELMLTGVWTHDHALMAPELEQLEQLGLPVKVGVPAEERALMDLFPQPRGRQAPVEYVPSPHVPRMPPGREATGGRR
jgi:hypothetical protein